MGQRADADSHCSSLRTGAAAPRLITCHRLAVVRNESRGRHRPPAAPLPRQCRLPQGKRVCCSCRSPADGNPLVSRRKGHASHKPAPPLQANTCGCTPRAVRQRKMELAMTESGGGGWQASRCWRGQRLASCVRTWPQHRDGTEIITLARVFCPSMTSGATLYRRPRRVELRGTNADTEAVLRKLTAPGLYSENCRQAHGGKQLRWQPQLQVRLLPSPAPRFCPPLESRGLILSF